MLYMRKFNLFFSVILFYIAIDVVHSKLVYHPEVQRQISQHKLVATWEEAKAHCEREGASLASPLDTDLLNYMRSIIEANNHTTPYFIGIKARHHEELQFVTEEGVTLEDLPEALSLVEQLDPRDGDCLCMDGHTIRVVPCWTRLPYICYTNKNSTTTEVQTTTDMTTPKDDAVYCGSGYKLSSTGSYYKVYEAPLNWYLANLTCALDGGYLAILNDVYEAQQVKYAVLPMGSPWPKAWIGVEYLKGINELRSIHGDSLANLFHEFERNRPENTSECVALKYNRKLTDWPCTDEFPFICEKDSTCDPSTNAPY